MLKLDNCSSVSEKYVLFPIKNKTAWDFYKQAETSFWTAEEIDLIEDKKEFDKLKKEEQYFIKNVLSFFAGFDGLVNDNLNVNFIDYFDDPSIKSFYGFQYMIENIHCVSGETSLLTDKGYINIQENLNKNINIWNGEEFSKTIIKYTGDSELIEITLSNGMSLKCTPNHKWFIRTGNQLHPENCKKSIIFTKDLKLNDVIYKYDLPIIDNEKEIKNPYLHGFFCGDGSYCNNYPQISLYGHKINLFPEYKDLINKQNRFYITKLIDKPKFFVPFNCSIKTKLNWLAGYLDADGCINLNKNKSSTSIQCCSISFNFLKDIQYLLSTLGIDCNIKFFRDEEKRLLPDGQGGDKYYDCKKCWVMYITGYNVNKLIKIGFKTRRLKIIGNNKLKQKSKLIKIIKIEQLEGVHPTYCFTEPKRSSGIFNGILTGNSETYSLLIDTYITNKKEKDELFRGLENNPAIKAKCDWATKYMNSKCDIATKIFAFALVEGLLFQSSFCAIFYMKKRGLLPGLSFANQLISRDEGLHFKFAAYIYNEYCDKLSVEKEDEIIKEAVRLSKDFATESLPVDLIGMNSNTMKQYIEFVADYLLYDLSKRKLYNQKNPYDWMDLISLQGKTNFFDLRVAEYQKSKVGNTVKENTEFKIDFNMI